MLFNFVAVYVFQGLHSIAGFKNILYLCHKWLPSVFVSTARKNIQTEKVFCWRNGAFIYHIWSQHGYELITLLRWANQNAGNAITIVQFIIILIIMPLRRKVVLLKYVIHSSCTQQWNMLRRKQEVKKGYSHFFVRTLTWWN